MAIIEQHAKTADELRNYIRFHYYADVEVVDPRHGVIPAVADTKRFRPSIFIISETLTPEERKDPESAKMALWRHVEYVRQIVATHERRPYLVSVCCSLSIGDLQYSRFKARLHEFGFDYVCMRSEVNQTSIGYWISQARKLGLLQ